MPVPGPTMMTGRSVFSGRRKCFAVWMKTGIRVESVTRSARNVEETPCRFPSVRIVAQGVHGQMHLPGMRLQTGGDGVEAGLELSQQLDELAGGKPELG